MCNLNQEIAEAKDRIRMLDAAYLEELKIQSALSEPGTKRRAEDRKGWMDLLQSLKVDSTKLAEFEKADAKKAEATYRALEKGFKIVPNAVLAGAADRVRIDDHLDVTLVLDEGESYRHWLTYPLPYEHNGKVERGYVGEGGKQEGSCGSTPSSVYDALVKPRSYSVGAGAGWDDQHTVSVKCWFWYYISGAFIKRAGTVFVWPYFDIHGGYWVRSNDGYFTSKEASIRLSMTTSVWRPEHTSAAGYRWNVLNKSDGNIDEDGRVDFTGWNKKAKGESQVKVGESLTVQVVIELRSHVEGSGSHALLDFQNGDGNYIRIPFVRVWVP